MKNVILGMLGCAIAIYVIAACLSIYSIAARKNEMENCVSQILEKNLKRYYATDVKNKEVEACVRQELLERMYSSSKLSIEVNACDMTAGILSVRVKEQFLLPGGKEKTLSCSKTILVETEEILQEETEETTEKETEKRREHEKKTKTDSKRKARPVNRPDISGMRDGNYHSTVTYSRV